MYKFNPQHIADLSSGKSILGHTKKEEDLPLLRAVLKEAFPNDVIPATGVMDYYLALIGNITDWTNYNTIPTSLQHLPIIPLHDFLLKDELPKEDLDRIDKIDKDLQELKAILKVNGYTIAPQGAFNTLPVKPTIDLEKLEVDLDTALSNKTNEPLKEWLLAKRAKAEIAEPKEELLVQIRGDQHGNHNYIQVSNGPGGFTQDQADQIADLIRWVLYNQETVLKLKNK
jgi:hypothetical protein